MAISRCDLEPLISDLEGKNLKFRFLQFLCIVPKNISVHFYHPPMKTVGGVCENAQNQPKNSNDLSDLDFDLETSRSLGYVDLVHTYLPC